MNKTTTTLLLAGLLLCLLQVWLPAYYITGDGPCHVYNAQILYDFIGNKNVAFYTDFYSVDYQANPNWLATITMALLMFIVNGIIAEKIFLTIYILLFTGGFYLLLKKITNNTYWPLVVLLFVFPHTLTKGFYNFSFSIALYFWMVWAWLHFLERKKVINALMFFAFTAFLFFTHLLAFVFGAVTCGALVLSYAIANTNGLKKTRDFFLGYAGFLLLFLTPFIIMAGSFAQRQGGLQIKLKAHFTRLIELAEFKYLVNITRFEDFFAELAGLILLLLLGISFLSTGNTRKINKYDGFLFSFLFALLIYLVFPEEVLGRLMLISMRMQPFVFILACCCVAYRFPSGKISYKQGLTVLTGFIVLGIICISYRVVTYPGKFDIAANSGKHLVIFCAVPLVVLFLVFCVLFFKVPLEKLRNYGACILFICASGLCIVRLPTLMKASSAEKDILSAERYISPYKVLLPLDFSPAGIDEAGHTIADRNWIFNHAGEYIGVGKPLIILDNYEANMGYFPINWKEKTNPYWHLSKGAGIEGLPACADIEKYKNVSGVSIDYILMWCYDPAFLQNKRFAELYADIQSGYHIVYTSATQRTILYAKNTGK